MRNKKLFLCLVLLISSIVISCKWQVPEKVSVKSNAAYELKAGSIEKSLDEYLDLTKLMKDSGNGVTVYDYYPDSKDNTQRYLIKVPLAEIPLDLDSVMAQVDLEGKLKVIDVPEQSFVVPEISIDPISVDMDLSSLAAGVNTALIGTPVMSGSGQNITVNPNGKLYSLLDNQNLIELGSVTYTSGSLVFSSADKNGTVKLTSGDEVTVNFDGVTEKTATVDAKGIATIDLAGVTIKPNVAAYTWKGTKKNPLTNEVIIVPFKAEIAKTSKVKSIEGFSSRYENGEAVSEKITIPALNLPNVLPASTGLKSVEVGNGELKINIDGLTPQPAIDLSINGGLQLPGTGGGTVSDGTVNLAGAKITDGESRVTGATDLKLENLSIDFTKTKLTVAPSITKLASITADIGKTLKVKENIDLPKEATEILDSISLNPSGVVITYTNTLPKGNDITLNATSTFLGITDGEVKFNGNTIGGEGKLLSKGGQKVSITQGQKVDFNVELKLPGATVENPSLITITNVTAGETYKLGMSLKPVIDWSEISLKADALNQFKMENQTVDLGIDLNSQLKELGKSLGKEDLFTGLSIGNLPVYVFCAKPTGVSAFDSLAFNATAELKVGNDSLGYLLGSKDETGKVTPAELKPGNELPNLPKDVTVTKSIKDFKPTATVDLGKTFSNIISKPGNLGLTYSVNASGASDQAINIRKSEMQGVAKIALEAYIDLGLALGVTNDIVVPVSTLMGLEANKDLTNGKLAELKGNKTVEEAAGLIKKLSVDYSIDALPCELAKNQDLKLNVNIAGLDPINIDLIKGKSIDIYGSQLKTLLGMEKPALIINDLSVTLPQGTIKVPRAKDIKASLGVSFALDGNNSVTIAEIKDKNGGKPKFDGNWDITVAGKNLNELNNGGNK